MPTFRKVLGFWFKLGLISFGGPAGQIAIMHRELVEKRRWIGDGHFLHALNFCMMLPGSLIIVLEFATHALWPETEGTEEKRRKRSRGSMPFPLSKETLFLPCLYSAYSVVPHSS